MAKSETVCGPKVQMDAIELYCTRDNPDCGNCEVAGEYLTLLRNDIVDSYRNSIFLTRGDVRRRGDKIMELDVKIRYYKTTITGLTEVKRGNVTQNYFEIRHQSY